MTNGKVTATPGSSHSIGPVALDSPLIAAPLAGYSDLAFRLLCRRHGAGMVFSEMISCHGLIHRQKATFDLCRSIEAERPLALQIFGAEPESMGEAAAILAESPADVIDINMGCPVRKVVKKGAGAALMRDPALARKVIAAVVKNSPKPVTVKIRSGWNHQEKNAVEIAKIAEDEGCAAVTIHGRTWSDGFGGRVSYDDIAAVRRAIKKIPVIANGDINTPADIDTMREKTGCELMMIGRAGLGNPWIFAAKPRPTTPAALMNAALELLDLMERHAACAPGRGKNIISRFARGFAGAAKLRQEIFSARDMKSLRMSISRGGLGKKGLSSETFKE